MNSRSLSFLSAALLFCACESDFEKQSHVSKLRILGVRADPAELIIQQGQPPPKTVLTALAVDPSGAMIHLRWALCTVQQAVPDPSTDCPGTQGVDLLSPSGSANLDLGQEPFLDLYNSIVNPPGGQTQQVMQTLHTGVPLLVGLLAATADAELPAATTVTLRTDDPANPINHNPDLTALQADQVTLADDGSSVVAAGKTISLTPVPASDAHETQADGTLEKLNYSFYGTGGDIQSLRSADTSATGEALDPSVDWVAPSTPGTVQLWVVVRDGRGGQGFITRTVQVK